MGTTAPVRRETYEPKPERRRDDAPPETPFVREVVTAPAVTPPVREPVTAPV